MKEKNNLVPDIDRVYRQMAKVPEVRERGLAMARETYQEVWGQLNVPVDEVMAKHEASHNRLLAEYDQLKQDCLKGEDGLEACYFLTDREVSIAHILHSADEQRKLLGHPSLIESLEINRDDLPRVGIIFREEPRRT